MNSFTKHRISVFGINGCHDAIKSSIIDVNQIIIERNSPADISEKMSTALTCLLYTSPSPRDVGISRMPSSA